jgi:hypothetical protein
MKIEQNAETNSLEFTAELPIPKGFRKNLRKIRMEEIGVTGEFVLKVISQTHSYSWVWEDKVLKEESCVGVDEAMRRYLELRSEVQKEPGVSNQSEKQTLRPVGITDPKDRLYVKCNLIRVSSKGYTAGRCYNIHDAVYRRADGGRITRADLDALHGTMYGQICVVSGQPGDETASTHSEVDSSD